VAKIVSNDEIMEMFREIDRFKNKSDLSAEELGNAVCRMQDEIIQKLSFLVYSRARKYRNLPNYEDLVQEGLIGLVKAVQRFKWSMFPNFFVFSGQYINNGIKTSASKFDIVFNPERKRVIYAEPDESEVDPQKTPDELLFEVEQRTVINVALSEFSERERKIVENVFGLNGNDSETLREIGPKFDLTHERVRQIKNRVVDKLKKNRALNNLNR